MTPARGTWEVSQFSSVAASLPRQVAQRSRVSVRPRHYRVPRTNGMWPALRLKRNPATAKSEAGSIRDTLRTAWRGSTINRQTVVNCPGVNCNAIVRGLLHGSRKFVA